MVISKSEYMMFLKHPAWLWLKKYDKNKLPKPDANLQALFDSGNLFEDYAEKLFPEAVSVGFSGYQEYLDMPERTLQALLGGATTLFQGRFEAEGLTCIVDVLKKVDDDLYDLYEIKASTKTKVEHELDLAFQVIVLELAGILIRNISVIHVNNEYVRSGDIDADELTVTEDITDAVRGILDSTRENIELARKVISDTVMPNISPRYVKLRAYSEWMDIYRQFDETIDEYSIYNLYSPGAKRIGELEDKGIELIQEIPVGFDLTEKQLRQVEATRSGEILIDKTMISEFLNTFEYPLYFLDYETFSGVIPSFDGVRPYQQVPFQYSLHIFEEPEGGLIHKEYLHREDTMSVGGLLKQLSSDIGDMGSIVVWYEGFEKKRNEEMAELSPEYSSFLNDVNSRVVDLMLPFFSGWYVDKDFFGSASIKRVLPILVPELSYKDLNIQDGQAAQRLWMQTILEHKNSAQKKAILNDLVEYCKLDTLAMVEIWKYLAAIIR